VKREAGYQRDKVQHTLEPSNWKPMVSIGQGVKEISKKDIDLAAKRYKEIGG